MKREHGQAAIEFALALPFLLGFIFFIVDVGLLGYSYVSVTNAVREGARCGAVGGTNNAVTTRVQQASGGLANFSGVSSLARGSTIGSDISVQAQFTYDWVTPISLVPGLSNFTFAREATMRMETAPPYTKAVC